MVASFLRLLAGRTHRPAAAPAGPGLGLFLHGRRDFAFDVISVGPFEETLRDLAPAGKANGDRQECIAALVCRDGNPLQRNTVAIEIGGRTVGYCPSYLATQYREWLEKWCFSAAGVLCNAVIVRPPGLAGGRSSTPSVKLDIELPFKVTTVHTRYG
ncbi:hypothetical protein [Sphingobium nicotianae]|uniref:HIRAN domain-containing protein n=1 Tax=Sphingobium nicotianae TaxID=2782607 RepID=A0A9X1DAT5_9SPHN|nr:hypothetical protein [Sphingobium nicotianae]MBT2186516.1 hypothetical protein [Sphingobium nicotianae]